ncbi:MAG TPA: DUF1330 domain-containing protein [Candidatus Acidoferrum sp.]|nr:DUF1330 domain-containing protein [Candidatus Acidoferrum sp.]
MAAYFIVDVDVHNPVGMREYLERVPGTLTKYGGRYIVRGGQFEVIEGDWQPSRVVMLEFPDMEQAKLWYACEEYKEMKAARQRAAKTNVVLVQGM